MIRPGTALWALAVVLVGYLMFQVKYEVMHQEDELARIHRDIAASREQVRVLTAEWNFLSQPTRLDELAHRYLDLVPIGTPQLGSIDTIPLRNPRPETLASTASGAAPAPVTPRTVP